MRGMGPLSAAGSPGGLRNRGAPTDDSEHVLAYEDRPAVDQSTTTMDIFHSKA